MSVNLINKHCSSCLMGCSGSRHLCPGIGEQQFIEMNFPPMLISEDNLKLIQEQHRLGHELERTLDSLKIPDATLHQMVAAIQTFDFREHPILLDENLPYFAVEALRRGVLHPEHGPKQVGTILNFWAAYNRHQNKLETIAIFDERGTITAKSMKLLYSMLDIRALPYLVGMKFDEFLRQLQELPTSEQHFFVAPFSKYNTVSDEIHKIGVGIFNQSHENRMIASIGMMQTFLNVEFGSNAVKINPVIYQSTEKQIRECGLNDSRDVELSFPLPNGKNRTPERADGYLAPWYEFTYHDFYHCIHASFVPSELRKAFIAASDCIYRIPTNGNESLEFEYDFLAESLVDMEFYHFLSFDQFKTKTPSEAFWLELNYKIEKIFNNCPPEDAETILRVPLKEVHRLFIETLKHPSLDQESFDGAASNYRIRMEAMLMKRDKNNFGKLVGLVEKRVALLCLSEKEPTPQAK